MSVDFLRDIEDYAAANGIPIIRKKSAMLLAELVCKHSPKSILEIGTAIGYSGIVMLTQAPQARYVTIDINQHSLHIARQNFAKHDINAIILNDDAAKAINLLQEKFDFIFLDGPKSKYGEYLPQLLKLLNKNGVLVCDNVLFRGMIVGGKAVSKGDNTIVRNMRDFINTLNSTENLQTTVYDIDDGITVSIKTEE